MKPKRMVLCAAVVSALFAGVAAVPASAHGGDEGGGASGGEEVVVNTIDITWTLTHDKCDFVPEGTTINGSTVLVDLVTTRTRNDVSTQIVDSHAVGVATDQDGNRYAFRYDNVSKAKNSRSQPDVYVGRMVDEFRLEGTGPVSLHNGFTAVITDDRAAGTFTIDGKSSFGDPFDFDAGLNRCDPM
jgi:hypothetical protein